MGQFFIEDRYYETKLNDGTIISTRTKYVVDALMYYYDLFFKIAEDNAEFLNKTPPILKATSFEDAKNKIIKITDAHKKLDLAYKNIKIIDNILKTMEEKSNMKHKNNDLNNSENTPEK